MAPTSPARRSRVCIYGVLCVNGKECTREHLVVNGHRWSSGALSPATELCQLCWPDALGSGQGLPDVVWHMAKASPDFAQKVAKNHRCPVLSKHPWFEWLLENQLDALLDRLDALLLLRHKSCTNVIDALQNSGATMDLNVLRINMKTLHSFDVLKPGALQQTVNEALKMRNLLYTLPPPPPSLPLPTTTSMPVVECRICLDDVTTYFGALRHEESLCLVACEACMDKNPTPPKNCLRCQEPHLGWQRIKSAP